MTLIKSQISEAIFEVIGFSRKKVIETVETVLEIIKSTLESGDDLLISGFGKFQAKAKAERRGRNPATGEFMMLDSRKVVTFKCSGKLRARAKITSHFIHPKGICFAAHPGFRPSLPDPQLQNPRNSSLFLWFCSLGSNKADLNPCA